MLRYDYMARKPRVHYHGGAIYHVILRGNGGQAIFFDDKDPTRFYFLLQEGVERFDHHIHAFCLMNSRVHLSEVRRMVAWLILELEVSTLGELGKVTGRDVTTLSSATKRLQIRAREDSELARKMAALLEAVSWIATLQALLMPETLCQIRY